MMYLAEASVVNVVKKQYNYKLRGYLSVFTSMIAIQLLAMFFSLGGIGSMGTSSDGVEISVSYYSGSLIVIFTMLWAFISAILLTTKAYRNDDFAFVTNRFSSNLSNIAFFVTASVVGGVTAMLASTFLKTIIFFVKGSENMIGVQMPLQELLLGMLIVSLYLLLIFALGYLVGTLVQLHKVFAFIIPVFFVGVLFVGIRIPGITSFALWVKEFLLDEASVLQFLGKVIIISVLLFLASTILSNRMEVNR